jgi:starch synthase
LYTFNLDPWPLFSFIGRLLDEKGGDLLPHASALSLSEKQQINILILGSGNPEIENQLNSLLVDYKGTTTPSSVMRELAHFNYAGCFY